jgi:hypothetical protein
MNRVSLSNSADRCSIRAIFASHSLCNHSTWKAGYTSYSHHRGSKLSTKWHEYRHHPFSHCPSGPFKQSRSRTRCYRGPGWATGKASYLDQVKESSCPPLQAALHDHQLRARLIQPEIRRHRCYRSKHWPCKQSEPNNQIGSVQHPVRDLERQIVNSPSSTFHLSRT